MIACKQQALRKRVFVTVTKEGPSDATRPNAMALRIAAATVEHCTDGIAIARDAHPVKGSILFACRAIAKGEQIADEPMSSVISEFTTPAEFSALLEAQVSADEQKRLLRQSCPTGDGRVALEARQVCDRVHRPAVAVEKATHRADDPLGNVRVLLAVDVKGGSLGLQIHVDQHCVARVHLAVRERNG